MPDISQTHRLGDVDQLQQLVASLGWRVNYLQLAPGQIEVVAYAAWSRDMICFRERFACAVLGCGTSSPEAFDVMLCLSGSLRLLGEPMSSFRVGLFPPASEVDAVGLPGLETLHLQVERERLEREAAALGVDLTRESGLLTVAPGIDRVNRLRRLILEETGAIEQNHQEPDDREREIMDLLVAVFDASVLPGLRPRAAIGRTSELALEVRRAIDSTPPDTLEIPALAQRIGVGRHHLNRCFKRHYGLSIQSYVRIRHLHQARRILRRSTAPIRVTDIALSSGFRHLGRFSIAYRELFGETPRQTLRRASQPIEATASASASGLPS